MPKRRAPSDEEDEVKDNAHQSVSEGEVVKKPKKSSATSEKQKASAAKLMCVTLSNNFSSALRRNLARNRKKGNRVLRSTERSKPTKRETNTSILGATDAQPFASSKARYFIRCGSAKSK